MLCGQGLLDEQFSQLQQLQDETTPDFVEEVVALFFEDSERLLRQLTESLYAYGTLKFIGVHLGCLYMTRFKYLQMRSWMQYSQAKSGHFKSAHKSPLPGVVITEAFCVRAA